MNPLQPRHAFDDEKLTEMAASIKERGVLQPILVRRSAGKYQLVAGERRLRAAKMAGLLQIPALLIQATDEQCLELSLIENLQRENLNPVEEARGYEKLITMFGLTQEEAAARVGKDRSTVTNSLRLLKLPAPILGDIETGRVSPGHARALLSIEERKLQTRLWSLIVKYGLSVRQAETRAREMKEQRPAIKQKTPPPPGISALEEKLMTALGTRVRIRPVSKTSGKIIITYTTLEDIDRILEAIGIEQGD
jgi:ParB family chromosome partitioning protein